MTRAKDRTTEQARSRIPEFQSREEEAQWWDTHDVTDYLDELKPVRVRFAKRLSEAVAVRLDKETLDKLRKTAHEMGIGPTVLIRMWILERLKELERRNAS